MGNRGLFSTEREEPVVTADDRKRKRSVSHLDQRGNALHDLTSGGVEDKTLLWVDPAFCKIWEGHDRQYDLLSIDDPKCLELVEGIKAQGRQEIPAVVRALKNDPDYKYEVIVGARRHWAITWLRNNNYPNYKYLVDVRDLTEEESFRLNDMENRDREDVSDYERALNYKNAINSYYNGEAQKMAERIGYTKANLSYLLSLADLPGPIIRSFGDPRVISVNNGRVIKKLLKIPSSAKKLIAGAKELASLQLELKKSGKPFIEKNDVMKRLVKSTKAPSKKSETKKYSTGKGEVVLNLNSMNNRTASITLTRSKTASREETIALFTQLLDDLN